MSDMNIRSGDLYPFAFFSATGTNDTFTVSNRASLPLYKISPWTTVQGIVTSTTFGLITATLTVQGTNDVYSGVGFTVGQCVLNSSTTVTNPLNLFAAGQEMLNDILSPAVAVGMLVTGVGIPIGTYVAAVASSGSITLSAAATITSPAGPTGTSALKFFNNCWAATPVGTITLSGTTAATAPYVTDSFFILSTYKFMRVVTSNITGTGATASAVVGY